MAVSTSYAFNLGRDGLITEAAQRVGICPPDGRPTQNQIQSLGNSLNVLIKSLSLRGVLITATERYDITLADGTASYALPDDTVDVLPDEMYVRSTSGGINSDAIVENMARAEYMQLTDKATTGRPTRCLIERSTSAITALPWPVPDSNVTTLTVTRIRLLRDMTTGTNNMDLPSKYQLLLILGVAVAAAEKFGTSLDQAMYWRKQYDDEAATALADSTERGPLVFRASPSLRAGRRN